jgi:hypothetical protein
MVDDEDYSPGDSMFKKKDVLWLIAWACSTTGLSPYTHIPQEPYFN